MNVFNRVTLESLKKNKTRTTVTIIGIMLSAAMICAVTTFISSIQNYLLDRTIYKYGSWHASSIEENLDRFEELKAASEVKAISYFQNIGYAKSESKNEFKPYFYVIGADSEQFFDMLPVHLLSGTYPKNTNEILIPEHALSNGGMSYKLGDQISLEIGERIWEGNVMGQGNPSYIHDSSLGKDVPNVETIKPECKKSYTVVGIYERPVFENYTAPGYTAITLADITDSSKENLDVYLQFYKPTQTYQIAIELGLNGAANKDVLMFMGKSIYMSFMRVLYGLVAIVIGLIVFGSVSLIYNAFAISVSERTKQFGLLSSIGATKKQLKRMVYIEALYVSAVGIPLGILVGIGGIAVTLLLIGNKFTSLMGGYDAPMRICVSWPSIVIAIIIALITVLISAWIPSKRATKITAVEAIRQSGDIKASQKEVKTSKLAYKLFGLPGVLASKHFKRNKKKYRATVISLFMSIVLFISASAFTNNLVESVSGSFETNGYDIYFWTAKSDMGTMSADELLSQMLSDKSVTGGVYAYEQYFEGRIEEKYLTEEFYEKLGRQLKDGEELPEGYSRFKGFAYFVSDADFDKLLSEYKLDRRDYYNPKDPKAIGIDVNTTFDAYGERFITVDALKHDENEMIAVDYLEDGSVCECTLKTGAVVIDRPFYVAKSVAAYAYFVYPMSMYESVFPEAMQKEIEYSFCIQSKNHTASTEKIKKMLQENSLKTGHLYDYAADADENRNIVTIIKVFAYGFIVLISLIAAANVFNTISTNISLRRREFAMLKSVGMDQKGFNNMMNYECLLYGSKALILGLPVAIAIAFLINRTISGGYELSFKLPWSAIGISVFSVFLVVFATMLYSMSKIKKDNPIEALKNENL